MNSMKAVIGKVNIINDIYFDRISMILCLYLQLLTELNVKSEYGTSAGVFVAQGWTMFLRCRDADDGMSESLARFTFVISLRSLTSRFQAHGGGSKTFQNPNAPM